MFDDDGWTREERDGCAAWARECEAIYVAENGQPYPWLDGITTDSLINEILTDQGWEMTTPSWVVAQEILALYRYLKVKP